MYILELNQTFSCYIFSRPWGTGDTKFWTQYVSTTLGGKLLRPCRTNSSIFLGGWVLKMAVSEKCVFDLPFLVGLFPSTVKLIQNSEHNVCQVYLVGNDNGSEEAKQPFFKTPVTTYIHTTRFTFWHQTVIQSQKKQKLSGQQLFPAKTFRIKRVNRDIDDFATNDI